MRPAGGAVTGIPCSATLPSEAGTSPAIIFSNVDLPQPDGPRRLVKPPSLTSNDTCVRTVGPAVKDLPAARTDTAGASIPAGTVSACGSATPTSLTADTVHHGPG